MPPIRKGDGTPVTPKGISQVRTGDGRILFDGVAIPDSVEAQWDATQLALSDGQTVDPFDDSIGTADLPASESPTYDPDGINGESAVFYDGVDDAHLGSGLGLSTASGEFTVFAVVDAATSDGRAYNIMSDEDGGLQLRYDEGEIFYRSDDGSTDQTVTLSLSTSPEIVSVRISNGGETVEAWVDGDFQGDSTATVGGWGVVDNVRLGDVGTDPVLPLEGNLGEVVYHNAALSPSDRSDEEQRLANKFGISL